AGEWGNRPAAKQDYDEPRRNVALWLVASSSRATVKSSTRRREPAILLSSWVHTWFNRDRMRRTCEMEDDVAKHARPQDRSAIYVDDSAPATLHYSETSVIFPTLREARTAWLALSLEVKKNASITTN